MIFASGLKYVGVPTYPLGFTMGAVLAAALAYWLIWARPRARPRAEPATAGEPAPDRDDAHVH